jgi:hypothetical protein
LRTVVGDHQLLRQSLANRDFTEVYRLLVNFKTFVHGNCIEFQVNCLHSGLVAEFYVTGDQPVVDLAVLWAVFVMEFVEFTSQF